jgi:hypothetical protein
MDADTPKGLIIPTLMRCSSIQESQTLASTSQATSGPFMLPAPVD